MGSTPTVGSNLIGAWRKLKADAVASKVTGLKIRPGSTPGTPTNFMKKAVIIFSVLFSLWIAQSAMVTYKWNPNQNPPPLVNGLPAKYIKLYYGPALKTYTNSVIWPLTNTTPGPYRGWDQYNCVWIDTVNYVSVPVYGLQLSQQIFTAYSIINSNGQEGPLINESTCGYTVTNTADLLPVKNLKLK